MKEVEIGRKVVEWLQCQDWEVYQEVQLGSYSRVIDIVAVRPYKSTSLLWAIECKKSLSFAVAKQAWLCRGLANYASCAVGSKRSGGWPKEWLKRQGIGLITVQIYGEPNEEIPPFINRKPAGRLRDALREEQKTWAEAGNANGSRYSPFQDTARQVVRFVNKNPGCVMKDIMSNVRHHYRTSATFRSCIPRYIREGAIKGIEIRNESGKNTYWPKAESG